MSFRLSLLLTLAILGAFSLGACGSSPDAKQPTPVAVGDGIDLPGLDSKLPAYIDSVSAGIPTRAFSGYVLVAQHDQPIFSRGYGLADRAKQQLATADTSFRVGSVTKQFTAAAILRLEQDGKLSVSDPIGKHLPEYPAVGRNLTIHQLLTHTAGIPNFTDDPAIIARRAERVTVAQLLALFWDKPLQFPPGSRFAYSNSGYIVLGAIIERASGKPYATYLAEALFAPAGMTRTVVGDAEHTADRAEGYQLRDDQAVPADPIDMSFPFAAGAVRSTANDLVRWHRALSGDAILDGAHRAKLYQPALENYAYGWLNADIEKQKAVWHNGGIDGFSTTYWRVPAVDVVVVAWSNLLEVPADPIGRAAVLATLGGTPTPIEKVKVGALDPAVVARVTGDFAITEPSLAALVALKLPPPLLESIKTIAISSSTAGIVLKPVGQSSVELLPTEDGSFYAAGPRIRLRFTLPASGPASEMTLEQGPLEIKYQRGAAPTAPPAATKPAAAAKP